MHAGISHFCDERLPKDQVVPIHCLITYWHAASTKTLATTMRNRSMLDIAYVTIITPNGPPTDCRRLGRMMTLNLMTGISERVQANVGRPMDSSEELSPCEVVFQIRLETLLESLDSPYKLGRKSTTNTYRSRTRRGGARKECQSKVFSRCELKYDSLR